MYLFVLGNLPLSLFTFTQFFFQDRIQHCVLQNLNMAKSVLILLSCFVWVLLLPILQSIPESEMGVESLKLVFLKCEGH